MVLSIDGFNSQPPEGGWTRVILGRTALVRFQLTAARRRLVICTILPRLIYLVFQLTAARRRLGLSLKAWVATWPFQLTAARRRLGCNDYF